MFDKKLLLQHINNQDINEAVDSLGINRALGRVWISPRQDKEAHQERVRSRELRSSPEARHSIADIRTARKAGQITHAEAGDLYRLHHTMLGRSPFQLHPPPSDDHRPEGQVSKDRVLEMGQRSAIESPAGEMAKSYKYGKGTPEERYAEAKKSAYRLTQSETGRSPKVMARTNKIKDAIRANVDWYEKRGGKNWAGD
tara:strand:+ start:1072 stop:1665 length:594 start_codon:yes stop_codon:yes gene_type:complete